MMTSKYPNCECKEKRFDYLRRRYKNGTLHMFRKCPSCQKVAQNAMRTADYDVNWIETLQIVSTDGRSEPVQTQKQMGHLTHQKTGCQPKVQSRADQIHAKLQRHIQRRTL